MLAVATPYAILETLVSSRARLPATAVDHSLQELEGQNKMVCELFDTDVLFVLPWSHRDSTWWLDRGQAGCGGPTQDPGKGERGEKLRLTL